MANISRPFQIALVGIVVLAGVWLFALQGHSQSSSGGSSSAPSSSSGPSSSNAAGAREKSAAAPTPTYHGPAPGVSGLTHAIAKANGAVATSQQNARQLESASAAASSSSSSTGASTTSSAAAAPTHTAAHTPATTKAPATTGSSTHAAKPSAPGAAPRQKQVEAALAAGNVVVVLFWDKKGSDDVADARAVRSLAHAHSRVSVAMASAREVAAFGTVTRGVQVFGTPTVLVVGKHGRATVLTGLTDAFSLQQAVHDARRA